MGKRQKLEMKSFRVHWSVLGINTFAPLYRTYTGLELTKEDVREHHIKTVVDEGNKDYNDYGFIIVPKHITIHEIIEVETDE